MHTACEIVIAGGVHSKAILAILQSLDDAKFRTVEQISGYRAGFLDLQLRAHALLRTMADEEISVEGFLIQKKKSEGPAQSEVTSDEERRKRDLVSPLLPIYAARARIILGKVPPAELIPSLNKSIDSFKAQDYRFKYEMGSWMMRKATAHSLASLMGVSDPPTSEEQFRGLWKLYFLSLIGAAFRRLNIESQDAARLFEALEQAGLLVHEWSLRGMLRAALDYAKRVEGVAAEVKVNPVSGQPEGVSAKLTFREPSTERRKLGYISVDCLLEIADRILGAEGMKFWVVLDRLDVAFAESGRVGS